MKRAILIFSALLTTLLNAFSLKDKIVKGNPGDYMVTEQMGTYTILFIRSVSPTHILLEEIDAPRLNLEPSPASWKEWIFAEAPGHTAWVSFLIDLEKNKLLETYSHSRSAWLYAEDPNNFLSRLMMLSLEQTPTDKRKRIGPPPSGDEDHRALWMPSVIFEGKKMEKPSITAWMTKWPFDNSIIAGCEIELYFSGFAFPYWIEIKSPHYKAAIRTIDSGRGMQSPKAIVFQQSPFFIGSHQMNQDALEFHIHCPPYHSKLRLMAMDLSTPSHPMTEVSQATPRNGPDITLKIPQKTLETKLQKGHHYKWVLISSEYPDVVVYSDTPFHW
ncbi:MAG TPA: hypothetical protein VHK67_04545 [Rhabdochlamydiaceae bacterium]|jgi:hypothetical protein|nr:hypothetical protein [Rhabdochlamydiaceae bacterium]